MSVSTLQRRNAFVKYARKRFWKSCVCPSVIDKLCQRSVYNSQFFEVDKSNFVFFLLLNEEKPFIIGKHVVMIFWTRWASVSKIPEYITTLFYGHIHNRSYRRQCIWSPSPVLLHTRHSYRSSKVDYATYQRGLQTLKNLITFKLKGIITTLRRKGPGLWENRDTFTDSVFLCPPFWRRYHNLPSPVATL